MLFKNIDIIVLSINKWFPLIENKAKELYNNFKNTNIYLQLIDETEIKFGIGTLRDDLYKLINFYPTGNEVSRPKTIEKQVITNPDCPTYSHYIELTIGPGKTYKFIPVLYSDTPYNNGGLFFEYMNYGMYAIEKDYNTGNYVPKIDPVTKDYIFIDPHDYREYFVKIGENASEDTHPEMIIGASFMDVYNIPTLDLLIKLKQQLS
ncbi:hypothetical protein ABK040_006623 [Willaertia magna]